MFRLSTLALMISTLSAVVVQANDNHSNACNGWNYSNPEWYPPSSAEECPSGYHMSTGIAGTTCFYTSNATFTSEPEADCATDPNDLNNNTSPNIYCDLDGGFGTCWQNSSSGYGYFYFANCNESMFSNIIWTSSTYNPISTAPSDTEWELCAAAFSSS